MVDAPGVSMLEVVTVTGHRPEKLGGYKPNPLEQFVRQRLRECFEQLKPSLLYSGMALGVDQWAVEIAIDMGIPFIAAVPFNSQALAWRPRHRAHYLALLKLAQRVHIVSPGKYAPSKMQGRNKWMIDRCHVVVAVWNGRFEATSGTSHAVKYALKRKRPLIHLDPREFTSNLAAPGRSHSG